MVDEDGGWDWSRLSPWLSKDTLERIVAIPPPRVGLGSDSPGWRWEDNRKFTTRSAYGALSEERLLTNEERVHRHLSDSERYSICNNGTESIEHALRLCSKARQVWESMVPPSKLSLFDSLSFENWLLQCVKNVAGIGVGDDLWNTRFAVTCWLIWKTRCANIFGSVEFNGEGLARYSSVAAA
ncbi:hypothetical protein V6N11_043979 [Hibiscus sabdariffa]|uniref:Uncharacterized protein n=1 Tax=Hibiscus sabdariffa TaxID=183260 RepID=A0ABR2REJ4_9ROSI